MECVCFPIRGRRRENLQRRCLQILRMGKVFSPCHGGGKDWRCQGWGCLLSHGLMLRSWGELSGGDSRGSPSLEHPSVLGCGLGALHSLSWEGAEIPSNTLSPFLREIQLNLQHFGQFEPFLAAKGKGGREKFQEVGVASPTQWELFLAIFHCAANGKDHGFIFMSQTVLGNSLPLRWGSNFHITIISALGVDLKKNLSS